MRRVCGLFGFGIAAAWVVAYTVSFTVPADCPKGQKPDLYTGACLVTVQKKMVQFFDDKKSVQDFIDHIPKGQPYKIENLVAYLNAPDAVKRHE